MLSLSRKSFIATICLTVCAAVLLALIIILGSADGPKAAVNSLFDAIEKGDLDAIKGTMSEDSPIRKEIEDNVLISDLIESFLSKYSVSFEGIKLTEDDYRSDMTFVLLDAGTVGLRSIENDLENRFDGLRFDIGPLISGFTVVRRGDEWKVLDTREDVMQILTSFGII